MSEEIINTIKEKKLLIERELFELLNSISDGALARSFLETLEKASGQKMITRASLGKNYEFVEKVVRELPGETRSLVESTFVRMGIQIEIKKETTDKKAEARGNDFRVFYSAPNNSKKIDIGDFVRHFRARYQQIQRMLMQGAEMQNLVSVSRIGEARQQLTIIGIVTEKRVTGNKNLIIKLEDLTGEISAFIRAGHECFSKAQEVMLDDVIAVKASGNRELIYAHDIIFPDAFKEKVYFEEDASIAFLSDIHVGSRKHLGKNFSRFLEWIGKRDDNIARKIKYIFFVGDNVDGVGVFPGQEHNLELRGMKEQYDLLASHLKKIPENITLFMCPGQHDSVRVAEPQPIIDEHYGESLRRVPNLVLVQNPSLISLYEGSKEFKVLMYHGASIHLFINEINELRLMKAHKCPAKAVKYMLRKRHLAPSHGVGPSIDYIPNADKDPMVIDEVPDILCTGEVHRLDVENYNGVVIITGSCWQAQTDYEEKVGNEPDPCKVPVFNLKTRELKVMDFSDEDK